MFYFVKSFIFLLFKINIEFLILVQYNTTL